MASNSSNNSIEVNTDIVTADTAWILISTALIFIMIPGLGYYYGGITRKKNQLTLLISCVFALGIVSFEWFLWGFSLSFSHTGSSFIGNLNHFALIDVGNKPHPLAPTVPANAFMIFQGMFAAITPALAFGSAAERTTLPVYLIFLFIWSTLVYNFVAYWTWAEKGFLKVLGSIDYAGGTPVHITSGFSALAYALCVGPRRTVDFQKYKPTNISDIYLGTALLWFGWFGFNGGSECAINSRSANAMIVTNLSACVGGFSWMFSEMIKHKTKRMSLNGFCAGAIAGLVCITPASGFVKPYFAPIFGLLAGVVCMLAVDLKRLTRYRYDDACDVLAVHGVGGIIGNLLTGIFAQNSVATMSGGAAIKGGWVDGHFMQILYQLASVAVPGVWSFVFTFLILQLIGLIPFLRLKLTPLEEELGGDWVELGESAYGHDLIDIEKEHLSKLKRNKESNLEILGNYVLGDCPINEYGQRIHEIKGSLYTILGNNSDTRSSMGSSK